MKKLATSFALFAMVGALGVAAPAWAAPGDDVPANCLGPAASTPACMHKPNGGQGQGQGQHHDRRGPNGSNNNGSTNNGTVNNGSGPSSDKNPNFKKPDSNTGPSMGNNNTDHTRGPRDNNNDNNNRYNNNNNNDNNRGPFPGHMGNDRHDHPDFRDFRRHFDFGHFARPNFPIRPGFLVPGFFDLQPLPPELFFYYPQYRGYLYFETPDGRIVIVSRRTHRIVAII